MTTGPRPLSSLAARVTRAQDRTLRDRKVLQRARAAWVKRSSLHPPQGRWVLAAYSLVGAAAAAAMLMWWESRPLRYDLDGLELARNGARQVFHSHTAAGRMRFSDGSVVQVGPNADLGVESVSSKGAAIRLDRGSLHANIVHDSDTDWRFRAGPFDVDVIGTRFDIDWNESSKALDVAIHEGAVRITGCSLSQVRMVAGEHATLKCDRGRPELAVAPAPPASAADPIDPQPEAGVEQNAVPALTQPSQPSRELVEPESEPAPGSSGVAPTDWRQASARGRLRDAYAAADAAGFEAECERATGHELLDLSDAALFAGRTDRAVTALLKARSRFGGSSASATAAYKLGRLASGRGGAAGDARTWFQTYLREAPSGSLAREALGRLIELDRGAGNLQSARSLSEEYLRKYPDGPHADLARSVAGP